MPYLLTHTLFGSRVLERLSFELSDPADFYLGNVGPDMFFFDRLPPPLFRHHQKIIGNLMHRERGDKLLSTMLECLDEHPNTESYIYGMLCHLALDASAHPYVESQHRGLDHSRFEVTIDMQLYREFGDEIGLPAEKQRNADVKKINAFVAAMIEKLYYKNLPRAYARSNKKFFRIQRLLWDPNGKKRRFAKRVDRLIKKKNFLAGFVMTVNLEDADDCRNLAHRSWAAPWNPAQIRQESFDNLFDIALDRAVKWIEMLKNGEHASLYSQLHHLTMDKGEID
ncbi:MAG: zinc dependent phospholipase C family protein [Clostridia bacterium]|nr:zinc dependent phospholipase C family protein [Clostridia bacterium]